MASSLKKVTGQDINDAESKREQRRISFRNYAKVKMLANKFSQMEDIASDNNNVQGKTFVC